MAAVKKAEKAEKKAKQKEDKKPVPKAGRIVSYDKLDSAIRKLFDAAYPDGGEEYAVRYPKPNGDFFYAVPFDTETEHFLVKVDVKIDMSYDVDDDKVFYGGDGGDMDGAPEAPTTDVDDLADSLADDFNDPA